MDIEARLDKINDEFPILIQYLGKKGGLMESHIFRFADSPGGMEEYLAVNYSVVPSMSPGIVRCEDDAEVELLLTLLEDRVKSPSPFDYEKVLKAAHAVFYQGLHDGMGHHCEDGDPESDFPMKDGEVPYWVLEGLHIPSDATLLYTANWSDLYGSYGDIPVPDGENSASLLFYVQGDAGSESHVELGSEEEMEDWWGIKEGSLEWFLWAQLFCHNCNLAVKHPEYAYVRYDIMAGVWLTPDPENLEYLEAVIKKEDFKRYYDDRGEEDAIALWMSAVRKKLVEDSDRYEDHMVEEFNLLAAKHLPDRQIEVEV